MLFEISSRVAVFWIISHDKAISDPHFFLHHDQLVIKRYMSVCVCRVTHHRVLIIMVVFSVLLKYHVCDVICLSNLFLYHGQRTRFGNPRVYPCNLQIHKLVDLIQLHGVGS